MACLARIHALAQVGRVALSPALERIWIQSDRRIGDLGWCAVGVVDVVGAG